MRRYLPGVALVLLKGIIVEEKCAFHQEDSFSYACVGIVTPRSVVAIKNNPIADINDF